MLVINMKEDLERALKNKEPSFIIKGELAEKMKKAQKITTIDKMDFRRTCFSSLLYHSSHQRVTDYLE
ncbi:hypothetical protein AAUPMC_11776 [Pasteurella multocida subsp. multocida str. Anand1_cattle]|nr:hypothetical protein AAUPMC_11776 [Pasteurella multocida subsp. multocida str. Anand1_cattle]